jgi:hypothetical protein
LSRAVVSAAVALLMELGYGALAGFYIAYIALDMLRTRKMATSKFRLLIERDDRPIAPTLFLAPPAKDTA